MHDEIKPLAPKEAALGYARRILSGWSWAKALLDDWFPKIVLIAFLSGVGFLFGGIAWAFKSMSDYAPLMIGISAAVVAACCLYFRWRKEKLPDLSLYVWHLSWGATKIRRKDDAIVWAEGVYDSLSSAGMLADADQWANNYYNRIVNSKDDEDSISAAVLRAVSWVQGTAMRVSRPGAPPNPEVKRQFRVTFGRLEKSAKSVVTKDQAVAWFHDVDAALTMLQIHHLRRQFDGPFELIKKDPPDVPEGMKRARDKLRMWYESLGSDTPAATQ